MNKRSVLLVLAVLLLMIAAIGGLPIMANRIVREEMRKTVLETCTPPPAYELGQHADDAG